MMASAVIASAVSAGVIASAVSFGVTPPVAGGRA